MGMMPQNLEKPITRQSGPDSRESQTDVPIDRRSADRYSFSAAAKIMELRSQALVTGRSSDLGLGGCYIDVISPFATDSIVRVRLEHEMKVFEATAIVVYAQPSIGMGLTFRKIEPKNESILREWVAEASGGASQNADFKPGISGQELFSKLIIVQQALGDTIKLMVRKRIISEMEGAALLREISK
jgi:PilZ domain-containing protein